MMSLSENSNAPLFTWNLDSIIINSIHVLPLVVIIFTDCVLEPNIEKACIQT